MDDTQQAIEQKALAITTHAQSIVVASSDDMQKADIFNKGVRAMIKEVDDVFSPMAYKAFQAHREITRRWKEIKQPLEDAMSAVTNKVRAYIQEEQRKAKEEERRLREEARKLEEERRLAEMVELEKEGRHEEAEEILTEPITFVAPTVQADIPKYDARQYRKPTPKARVIDIGKFLAWVVQSKDRYSFVIVNDKELNLKAKSLGKTIAQTIPGTEYFED